MAVWPIGNACTASNQIHLGSKPVGEHPGNRSAEGEVKPNVCHPNLWISSSEVIIHDCPGFLSLNEMTG